jgi:succinate-semialdehyde dehydrogenase/glutarate-semialdehyde dehydrogenase
MTYELFIDGQWRSAVGGRTMPVINPATEQEVRRAARAGPEDAAEAVRSAARGLQTWRATSAWERSRIIRKLADIVRSRQDEIAIRLTEEMGKPLVQAVAEAQGAAEVLDWFADEARRVFGQVIEARVPDEQNRVVFEPVGIVAGLAAWNFPAIGMCRKLGPALAAGCSIICRPASEAPGAAVIIVESCLDAGVPAGVVNLLTGPAESIVPVLMQAPEVRCVSFTGSVSVGQKLMREAATTIKRLTLELGGHAPVIVFPDADVTYSADMLAAAKFRNAGQVCVSPSRFMVHSSIARPFIDRLSQQIDRLQVGDGTLPTVDLGPLATARRVDALDELVRDAVDRGAKVVRGGKRPQQFNRGFFYEPTLITDVDLDARIMNEEPFGPVAIVNTYEQADDALSLANRLNFGLGSYVFTRSMTNIEMMARRIEAGVVMVNTTAASRAETPFGGIKASGFGREGGTLSIQDYLSPKYINIRSHPN